MTKPNVIESSPFSFMPRSGHRERGFGMPSFMPVFAADDGSGDEGGGEGESQNQNNTDVAAKKEAEKHAREASRAKKALEDANKNLQTLQDQLKRFDGIDPDQVRALLEKQTEAEKAAQKAEEDRLRAAGDFESLKRRMADEHQKELDAERKRAQDIQKQTEALNTQIYELTIGQAFASSNFIREDTLLPPAKARRAYADYFEVKEGKIVAYDRPANEQGRVPLVDSKGRDLPFEEAIKQIVEADTDRDHILKSKQQAGSGQRPSAGRVPSQTNEKALTGVAAIAAALTARKK